MIKTQNLKQLTRSGRCGELPFAKFENRLLEKENMEYNIEKSSYVFFTLTVTMRHILKFGCDQVIF